MALRTHASYSLGQVTFCDTCHAGSTYADATTTPVLCSAGTTSDVGQTVCQPCQVGMACPAPSDPSLSDPKLTARATPLTPLVHSAFRVHVLRSVPGWTGLPRPTQQHNGDLLSCDVHNCWPGGLRGLSNLKLLSIHHCEQCHSLQPVHLLAGWPGQLLYLSSWCLARRRPPIKWKFALLGITPLD